MNMSGRNIAWVIVLSFLGAFVLTILPLPALANWFRPEWVLLVLICWNSLIPDRVGVGAGWISGLVVDVLGNYTVGEHALIFTFISYLVVRFSSRIKFFLFWQKSCIIFGLILLSQILQIWLEGIFGNRIISNWYWFSVPVTTLFWPWIMALMQRWQQKYNIE